MMLNWTVARCVVAALLASASLAGCGQGEPLIALRAENEQMRAQTDTALQQVNELRSALGEIRARIDVIRGNLQLGAYARSGRSLSQDLDSLVVHIADLEAHMAEPGREGGDPARR